MLSIENVHFILMSYRDSLKLVKKGSELLLTVCTWQVIYFVLPEQLECQ